MLGVILVVTRVLHFLLIFFLILLHFCFIFSLRYFSLLSCSIIIFLFFALSQHDLEFGCVPWKFKSADGEIEVRIGREICTHCAPRLAIGTTILFNYNGLLGKVG